MTTLVEWRKEFETGIPDVDFEHREIVELINELPSVLAADPSGMALQVLGDINARIGAHFALEERHMRESAYAEYRDHKRDHDRLLDELRDLMDDFEITRQGSSSPTAAIRFYDSYSDREPSRINVLSHGSITVPAGDVHISDESHIGEKIAVELN